ncbi:HlyD family efflux transporter periplasmic adaptor subunit [Sphingomonas sp.]|uniref:efflux RND transporter periplasmic adaptor subunit n=1 Tax=Sphingomonas sp. TaxID=28214 RepID=UPI0025EEB8EB|nr:HlyD family efflux transporter periplasmic adaptor subunit [Sphingomonas sp.]
MAAKRITGPRILLALIVVALAVAVYVATRVPPVEVEAGSVTRGPMTVTVDDLAETRVRDLYTVSAPVGGELLRVPLKPGARVVAGVTVLARIKPPEPAPLDARTVAQIEGNIATLEAQADAADAQSEVARTAVTLSGRQFARLTTLYGRGFVARAALDEAEAARDRANAGLRSARRTAEAAHEAVRAARAGLIPPQAGGAGRGIVDVRAPVGGFLLSVPQESARVVLAGTPIAAVGDATQIELVTDLLSADAVQVQPGAAVSVEDWGGAKPLVGRVRLVEPYGFLKVSALGVEEQRVNVVIDLLDPPSVWARLGHGFRATVRITVWSANDRVRVPVGALFRKGDQWQVFRISSDRRVGAVTVKVGHMNADWAEILAGLNPGDRVVLHPGDKVTDGTRIAVRK